MADGNGPKHAAVRGRHPVVVIGAGPAGLATAYELQRRGVACRVLERGPAVAHTWRNLYDSLTLHTGRHLSALPGARFPRGTPLFPSRANLVDYLQSYRDRFDLHVETDCEVRSAERHEGGWHLDTTRGPVETATVVVATGIIANPVVPHIEGQERFGGPVRHAVEYRRPDGAADRKLLVIGCGNTAGDISTELAEAGADVTVAVRTGANVVPLTLFGLPIQYVAWLLHRLPDRAKAAVADLVGSAVRRRRGPPVLPVPPWGPLDSIPMIGFHMVDAIQAGRVRLSPGVASLEPGGARFTDGTSGDFDEVILATGYRPALDFLGDAVRTDSDGHAIRSDRITSVDAPALFFVGHNYDALGGLRNITLDARLTAARIARN